MIDREHALPVSRQVKLVGIARSSAYYQPQPVSEADLKPFLARFKGALHMRRHLERQAIMVPLFHLRHP
ncbi:hypothetical protein KAF44_23840 (plasmid) [Cupriavidus necator]|nr:hypothetical protein KAF44_23840 [Cupriavidus necator]